MVHFLTLAEPALSLEARWHHGRPAGSSELVVSAGRQGMSPDSCSER